jgi:hypothetical protein
VRRRRSKAEQATPQDEALPDADQPLDADQPDADPPQDADQPQDPDQPKDPDQPEDEGAPGRRTRWWPLVAITAAFLAIAAGAVVLATSGEDDDTACPEAGPRRQVVLVTEGTVLPAVQQQAADILRTRLSAYDCGKPTVSVDGNRLRLRTTAGALEHLGELIAQGNLEFREVQQAKPVTRCEAAKVTRPAARLTACSKDGSLQYLLAPAAVIGTDVKSAKAARAAPEWHVIVSFTNAGHERFTKLTKQLVGRQLAIVLDGVVISAPMIQERIDGDAQISGSFTEQSAKALAKVLESGVLPVRLRQE